MCVIIQWDRVYQDGRREPQEELHYCPHRHDPGHNNVIEIRTLQDEHIETLPRAFESNSSRATGMAEYPIIEPRAQTGGSAEQRTDKNGKKKRPVVTKNDGYKLGFRFHIPFTSKSPKSKKEPKKDPPVIHVVDPPEQPTRPTVTYFRPQQFAAGPYQPYEQPRRQSFDRRYDYTAYPAEPGRPAETFYPAPNHPTVEVSPSLSAERRSRSRERRRTVSFQPIDRMPPPPPPPIAVGTLERPATTIVVPEVLEDSPPPVFREHVPRPRRPVVLTRSPSRERRPRARSSTPAPRVPVREHATRHIPRAPTPPRRNHSPRRLRRIEQDIRRVEDDLSSARRQARLEDARSREQRLARVERDLQRLYDQQDAEIELEQQLRVVRDNRAAFESGRRERIPRDRERPLSIHQPDHRTRTERDATRDRNDLEERGTRVINQAITNRREERENRDRRGDRRDNRALERREVRRIERRDDLREDRRNGRREDRRESSAHRAQRDRNRGGNIQRRNTISGNDHLIWDDDRERRRRRFF